MRARTLPLIVPSADVARGGEAGQVGRNDGKAGREALVRLQRIDPERVVVDAVRDDSDARRGEVWGSSRWSLRPSRRTLSSPTNARAHSGGLAPQEEERPFGTPCRQSRKKLGIELLLAQCAVEADDGPRCVAESAGRGKGLPRAGEERYVGSVANLEAASVQPPARPAEPGRGYEDEIRGDGRLTVETFRVAAQQPLVVHERRVVVDHVVDGRAAVEVPEHELAERWVAPGHRIRDAEASRCRCNPPSEPVAVRPAGEPERDPVR